MYMFKWAKCDVCSRGCNCMISSSTEFLEKVFGPLVLHRRLIPGRREYSALSHSQTRLLLSTNADAFHNFRDSTVSVISHRSFNALIRYTHVLHTVAGRLAGADKFPSEIGSCVLIGSFLVGDHFAHPHVPTVLVSGFHPTFSQPQSNTAYFKAIQAVL